MAAAAAVLLLLPAAIAAASDTGAPPTSDATDTCLACHEFVTPGIVADWRASRHATVTPEQGLARPARERRISAGSVPEALRTTSIGCAECHVLRTDAHPDAFDHYGTRTWVEQWLFWANSTRYASAMSGPDYAAFKNGWWDLTRKMVRMQEHLELLRRTRRQGAGEAATAEETAAGGP